METILDLNSLLRSPLPLLLGAAAVGIGANALVAFLLPHRPQRRLGGRLDRAELYRLIAPPRRGQVGNWLSRGDLDEALWREIKASRWVVLAFSATILAVLLLVFGAVMARYR